MGEENFFLKKGRQCRQPKIGLCSLELKRGAEDSAPCKIFSLKRIKYKAPSARELAPKATEGVHRAQRIIVCLRKQ